ncbi:hypothetical protein ABPG74_019226 [Tetrahymena malaccensis]
MINTNEKQQEKGFFFTQNMNEDNYKSQSNSKWLDQQFVDFEKLMEIVNMIFIFQPALIQRIYYLSTLLKQYIVIESISSTYNYQLLTSKFLKVIIVQTSLLTPFKPSVCQIQFSLSSSIKFIHIIVTIAKDVLKIDKIIIIKGRSQGQNKYKLLFLNQHQNILLGKDSSVFEVDESYINQKEVYEDKLKRNSGFHELTERNGSFKMTALSPVQHKNISQIKDRETIYGIERSLHPQIVLKKQMIESQRPTQEKILNKNLYNYFSNTQKTIIHQYLKF